MLKRVEIPGFGPYVCGRKRSAAPSTLPPFSAAVASAQVFNDTDSIRAAAKTAHPIFATMGNILGNDRFGVCACVAPLKLQAIIDCSAGKTFRAPTLDDVFWLYKQFNPDFDPNTGAGDNGCDLVSVINFWMQHGLYSDGSGKIAKAYAVDASNKGDVDAALEATGGLLFVGCDLPDAWPKIVMQGGVWDVSGPPDPDAGHATLWYGRNDNGVFDSTWGMEVTITDAAVAKYFAPPSGEVYAVAPA